ncbi:MAG: LysR family transcriptional regulator [Roseimicrobium sp.]
MAHAYLATTPFDLRDLHHFHALAESGSFTLAARNVGLTQSSLTRAIQGMEQRLGVALFERTTRRVTLTEAGRFLKDQSRRLVGDVDAVLKRMREEFTEARREVKVGVSRSVTLAHLPGLFAASQRHQPEVFTRVYHQDSAAIVEALDQRELDLGILCPPRRLPSSLEITHRFEDVFTLIAARESTVPTTSTNARAWRHWLTGQRWLMLDPRTNTGRSIHTWLSEQDVSIEPAMELDSFDVIIQLVATGMGIGLVPRRALAAFARRQAVQRLPWKPRFTRELAILARKERKRAAHVQAFVDHILF